MRKLTVSTFVSLDGVMQAPGGPDEDQDSGFELGGWSVNYWDEVMGAVMDNYMNKPIDLLLGRKTYEIFAAYWPHAGDEFGAAPLNAATKYVVSTTLHSADWGPSVLIADNVVEQVRQLKAQDGPELQVHGSAHLLQTLIANDLIDQYQLLIFPLLLGQGKRLFEGSGVPAGLRLIETKTASTGVIIASYERAGEIVPGSFALDGLAIT